ncbi:unnamed protein product, partial [Prorocentrum cordatum]
APRRCSPRRGGGGRGGRRARGALAATGRLPRRAPDGARAVEEVVGPAARAGGRDDRVVGGRGHHLQGALPRAGAGAAARPAGRGAVRLRAEGALRPDPVPAGARLPRLRGQRARGLWLRPPRPLHGRGDVRPVPGGRGEARAPGHDRRPRLAHRRAGGPAGRGLR